MQLAMVCDNGRKITCDVGSPVFDFTWDKGPLLCIARRTQFRNIIFERFIHITVPFKWPVFFNLANFRDIEE
jgi:hypothetical protein